MTLDQAQAFFGWCTLINVGLLILWVAFYLAAHDFMYRLHGKMFPMPVETFNAIHYAGMAAYKIAILIFCLVPYLALHLIG